MERVSYYAKLMKADGVSPVIDLKGGSEVAVKKAAMYLIEEGRKLGIDVRPTSCMLDRIVKGLWFMSLQVKVVGLPHDPSVRQERLFKLAQLLTIAQQGCEGIGVELVNYGIKKELKAPLLEVAKNNPCIDKEAVVYRGKVGEIKIRQAPVVAPVKITTPVTPVVNHQVKEDKVDKVEAVVIPSEVKDWGDYYAKARERVAVNHGARNGIAMNKSIGHLNAVLKQGGNTEDRNTENTNAEDKENNLH